MLSLHSATKCLIFSALILSSALAWKPNDCGFYYPPGSTPDSPQVPCKAGYYCPVKPGVVKITPVKCPRGKYCPPGSCVAQNCTCGYKCPPMASAPVECQPPFYCPKERATNQTICPMGYYCPNPRMCKPLKCPPGTFVTCPGKVRCEICDRGRYCPIPSKSIICPANYYCPAGSSAPAPCPKDHTCPLGSWEPVPKSGVRRDIGSNAGGINAADEGAASNAAGPDRAEEYAAEKDLTENGVTVQKWAVPAGAEGAVAQEVATNRG